MCPSLGVAQDHMGVCDCPEAGLEEGSPQLPKQPDLFIRNVWNERHKPGLGEHPGEGESPFLGSPPICIHHIQIYYIFRGILR